MKTPRKLMYGAALGVGLLASGCGNNSSSPPIAAVSVPDSASASGVAFVAFLQSLSGSDETSVPLTISDTFAVPAEETTEPQTLI